MHRWIFFLLAALAPRLLLGATELSTLYGEDLLGKPFTLEARAAGKTAVVIVGFSKEAGKPCQAFEDAFWADFGGDTRVAIANVAVLQGVPSFVMPLIKNGMRKSAPAERYPWKWILRQDRTLWQEAADYDGSKAPDEAYVAFLDDKTHAVIMRTHAKFSAEIYADLKEKLGLILDPPKPKVPKKKR